MSDRRTDLRTTLRPKSSRARYMSCLTGHFPWYKLSNTLEGL